MENASQQDLFAEEEIIPEMPPISPPSLPVQLNPEESESDTLPFVDVKSQPITSALKFHKAKEENISFNSVKRGLKKKKAKKSITLFFKDVKRSKYQNYRVKLKEFVDTYPKIKFYKGVPIGYQSRFHINGSSPEAIAIKMVNMYEEYENPFDDPYELVFSMEPDEYEYAAYYIEHVNEL